MIDRTAYFDGLFLDALPQATPQIVLLGAGYDTRLPLCQPKSGHQNLRSGHRPHPKPKGAMFKASAHRYSGRGEIRVDQLQSRIAQGCVRKSWEGVSYYLDAESVDDTLVFVSQQAHPASTIAFDYTVTLTDQNTDIYFGAPAAVLAADQVPMDPAEYLRSKQILQACFDAFDVAVKNAVGYAFKKGSRGGGVFYQGVLVGNTWRYLPAFDQDGNLIDKQVHVYLIPMEMRTPSTSLQFAAFANCRIEHVFCSIIQLAVCRFCKLLNRTRFPFDHPTCSLSLLQTAESNTFSVRSSFPHASSGNPPPNYNKNPIYEYLG